MLKTFLTLSLALSPALKAADNFNPEGWDTNRDFPIIGSEKAKKGGTITFFWSSYPPTLRTNGPNSNLSTTREIHGLLYESLIGLHPETLEYMPGLADYWKISDDKMKFRFHINPKAKWADQSPVTAEDVVESWRFRVRKDIKDPYSNMLYEERFEEPVAESECVVSVKAKKLNWRLFLYFGGMSIYPAKELKKLAGDRYLEDYNWKMFMGSGPYELKPENIKKDHSITVTKRKDYWAENARRNIGTNNFDEIKWIIIRDEELAFEKFKKGEVDYYVVGKAQRWVEECDFDKVKKGWIQKKKIYTKSPEGFSGFAFNMRKSPFNDRNVRKAFAYLFNRERLIEKLFYDEYDFIDSYYPGSDWGNPNNPRIRYNPRLASLLLKRAGWDKRNKEGWLVKDGKPFELTLEYGYQSWGRIHKVIQEDYAKAGIKINLKLIDPRTLMKKVDERNFTLHFQSWGALLFPNPISSWSSKLADKLHNNNITGFKDKRVDKLCEEYDITFDRKKQKELIRKIDSIIFRHHPYALAWFANFTRILYYNKFGHPKTYFSKYGDYRDLKTLWWFEPEKEKELEEAVKNGKKLPAGETIVRPWKEL